MSDLGFEPCPQILIANTLRTRIRQLRIVQTAKNIASFRESVTNYMNSRCSIMFAHPSPYEVELIQALNIHYAEC